VSLGKAFGVFGGVVLTSRAMREKIIAKSHIFKGATPLPLPLAQAALASVNILKREPARRHRLFAKVQTLRAALRAAGWEIADTPGPIIRLPMLSDPEVARLKKRLLAANIYPPLLKYGAASRGVFRFVISSEHTKEQLDRLSGVLLTTRAKAIQ
jgi:8-amino-7-oxononanoate synthase